MLKNNSLFRDSVLFPQKSELFKAECDAILETKPDRDYLMDVCELVIDLQSYLVNWKLRKFILEGSLKQEDIDNAVRQLYAYMEDHGAHDLVEQAKAEVGRIQKSEMRRMSQLEVEGKLHSVWGHDYASGLTYALRRGARWVTSNPAKINLFRKDFPEQWTQMVKKAREEHPDLNPAELVSLLYLRVCAISARELYPIFEATNGEYGYIFMQVNPRNIKDPDKMTREVYYWLDEMGKELEGRTPNVVIKLPAVHPSIKTAETLLADGIRVCFTLNYTYYQHDMFSQITEKGERRSFVVMMCGFLDDNVAKELDALGVEEPKKYARYASEAVIRKSYANLRAKKCTKTSIQTAAIRGPWTITNSLTAYADAPIYITTVQGKIDEFDSEPRDLTPLIDTPVPEEILAVLQRSQVFNAAYEADLLNENNIFVYPPLVAVLGAFNTAYDEIEESLK